VPVYQHERISVCGRHIPAQGYQFVCCAHAPARCLATYAHRHPRFLQPCHRQAYYLPCLLFILCQTRTWAGDTLSPRCSNTGSPADKSSSVHHYGFLYSVTQENALPTRAGTLRWRGGSCRNSGSARLRVLSAARCCCPSPHLYLAVRTLQADVTSLAYIPCGVRQRTLPGAAWLFGRTHRHDCVCCETATRGSTHRSRFPLRFSGAGFA